MGGRVFQAIGRDSVRLPTARMSAIADAAAGVVGGGVVPWLRSKDDHGDADVVVPASRRLPDAVAAAAVGRAVGLDAVHVRLTPEDPITFVGVETEDGLFQVDLIHRPDETAEFCRRFLSWGDLGAMIGLVAREMGIKFGMDGLTVPVRVPAAPRGSLLLTACFDEALDVLGLDGARHAAGFDDDADTAAFVGSGRHHDPKLYDPMRGTSEMRRRGRRRSGRDGHLALLRSHPAAREWPEAKGDSDAQRAVRDAVLDRFGMRRAFLDEEARLSSLARVEAYPAFSMELVASAARRAADHRDVKALIVVMREEFFPEDGSFPAWKKSADEAEVRRMVGEAEAVLAVRREAEAAKAARAAQHERNRLRRLQGRG